MRLGLSSLIIACATLGFGCSETAVDLVLAPTPAWTDPVQLEQELGKLVVTIDTTDPGVPLYPAGTTATAGNPRLEDTDGDGEVELVAEFDAADRRSPLHVRFVPGDVATVHQQVHVTVRGFEKGAATKLLAAGESDIALPTKNVVTAEVPFNLIPEQRAPQVLYTLPGDGTGSPSAARYPSVSVFFSKRMDPASVEAPGAIRVFEVDQQSAQETEIFPKNGAIALDKGVRLRQIPDGPSYAEFRLQSPLSLGQLRIVVADTVTDATEKRRRLDSDYQTPELQAYSKLAKINPTCPEPVAATCVAMWCTSGATMCGQEAGGCCPGPALTCGCTGPGPCDSEVNNFCQVSECPVCPAGTVCDSGLAICVTDCRGAGSAGACPQAKPVCSDSGICVTSTP